ncbi:T-complex protein 1 [Gonapodya prolifera JEL478]|uniref:CCT-theta n=1 Tax=Gonapodya prolifera (strain JEL478) TaxID=1344416 RepID=A0A139AY68_GONPJ|nr:T-complex protein 1 [Gonapodya prolifera JEL478]|eukprot:KXS21660.1 T-complex protein 1 [Gonapodya prolifera JEL478]
MALKIPKIGLSQLLKDGYKIQQGLDEAVYRNISACRELTNIVRTSYGPNGRNKMVINHLEKLFVTSDAATIMRELEVIHPAAKMIVGASQQQEQEVGDATNLVVVLAGELLAQAEFLLRMGLHPSEVIEGYEIAAKKALEFLNELVIDTITDVTSSAALLSPITTALSSKQNGLESLLAPIVVSAALEVMPKSPANFNTDSIRVVKILGGGVHDTSVVKGMVFGREPEGTVTRAEKAKVAVFVSSLDQQSTETKGTVLIRNAEEMLGFSKGEEKQLETAINEIAASGAKVVVTGSGVGDLALHFLNRAGLMVVKVLSKFDLRRLCRVVGATALARLGRPSAEELGYCDIVETVEIGSDRCTVFRQEEEKTKTATIVVRGGTQNMLDDIERAIDDGVNVVKALAKDGRLVAGAGATEIELARRLAAFGDKTPGLAQYSIKKFAEALEVVPRTLAENAGMDSTVVISKLYAAHTQGQTTVGVKIDEENALVDAKAAKIVDSHLAKFWAIKLATHAATTVLSVDQIIMSKPAGGPKAKQNKNWDEDDE